MARQFVQDCEVIPGTSACCWVIRPWAMTTRWDSPGISTTSVLSRESRSSRAVYWSRIRNGGYLLRAAVYSGYERRNGQSGCSMFPTPKPRDYVPPRIEETLVKGSLPKHGRSSQPKGRMR